MPQFKHGATSHQDIGGKKEISVLKTLLDIEKIQCGPTGMFKGEMKPLQGSKIGDYSLEIIEFLIKVDHSPVRKPTFRGETTIKSSKH